MTKSGHYQISNHLGNKVGTFFNWHPDGNVDQRTNLYYVQTTDFGKTWTTVDGQELDIPLTNLESKARVVDMYTHHRNVYLKDFNFDKNGFPVCLHVTSGGHEPGPKNDPREWRITAWDGQEWQTTVITVSDHNYDMGSLWIEEDKWMVVAPTKDGPQKHGAGGEIEHWQSMDAGKTWNRKKLITDKSSLNHNYVRRVVNGSNPFLYFWADGNPDTFGQSILYFSNRKGKVKVLPYDMTSASERPR